MLARGGRLWYRSVLVVVVVLFVLVLPFSEVSQFFHNYILSLNTRFFIRKLFVLIVQDLIKCSRTDVLFDQGPVWFYLENTIIVWTIKFVESIFSSIFRFHSYLKKVWQEYFVERIRYTLFL